MAKFTINKRVSLAILGELEQTEQTDKPVEKAPNVHKDDFVIFRAMTFSDAKKLQKLAGVEDADDDAAAAAVDEAIELLVEKFVRGEITDDETGEKVALEASDMPELPVQGITHCMKELAGNPDPK